jgi:large subunit ribosomal protein L10
MRALRFGEPIVNREQKAAVVDRLAEEIQQSEAIFAVDYRGLSVPQAAELRERLDEAGARFRVVKNTLSERAADQAGAESLKELLDGPTAFTFVTGDAALAAKVIATFRREHGLLEIKGGQMEGATLTVEEIDSIARLPARDVLYGQFVGVLASPLTGLVRGLGSLISGVAIQLEQIREQGLVGGETPAAEGEPPAAESPAGAEEAGEEARAEEGEQDAAGDEQAEGGEAAEEPAGDSTPSEEAPGDPVAEAETAEEETSETPSGADDEKEG